MNLKERDIYQIRFLLSMYKEKRNMSAEGVYDTVSQIALFYYMQIYGWAAATVKMRNLIIVSLEDGMTFDLKSNRKRQAPKALPKTSYTQPRQYYGRQARSSSRQRNTQQYQGHRSKSRRRNNTRRSPSRSRRKN